MFWRRTLGLRGGVVCAVALPVVVLSLSASCSSNPHEFNNGGGSAGASNGGDAGGSQGGSSAAAAGTNAKGGTDNQNEAGANATSGAGGEGNGCEFESCDCAEGDTQPCGPAETVGICHPGSQACKEGAWGECVGAQEAQARDCTSAMDNDCDGSPDNTIDDACKCTPGSKQACDEHPGQDGKGPCKAGEQACVGSGASGVWGPCDGAVDPKPADSCEEKGDDADCDGMENDGCTCVYGDTKTCADVHASKGVCAVISLNCSTSGKWPSASACEATSAELCANDQKDEDCDGQVNEGCECLNGKTQKCGKCNNGSQTCAAGKWGACTDDLILETTGKGPNMLCISAGTFDMGGDYNGLSEPVHSVTLPAFWMDEKEVTANQYAACVTANACALPQSSYEGCTYNTAGKGDHPINCLYQTNAAAFCTWAGKRLPVEEEWEYAARGTDGRSYPWGNAAPLAQARFNTALYTVAVGSISGGRSPFGLYDMAGNVAEWTSSHTCDYPASGLMPATCADNADNYYTTYRGGGYSSDANAIKTFARGLDPYDTAYASLGFRCAKSLP